MATIVRRAGAPVVIRETLPVPVGHVTIELKDVPEGVRYWKIYVGPGGRTFQSDSLRLNEATDLPLSGDIDWLIFVFYQSKIAEVAKEEYYFRDIYLEGETPYQFSWATKTLDKKKKAPAFTLWLPWQGPPLPSSIFPAWPWYKGG